MKTAFSPIVFTAVVLAAFTLSESRADPQAIPEELQKIKESTRRDFAYLDEDTAIKKDDLAKKYVEALTALEKKSTAEGNLDLVLHIREERDSVGKSGEVSAYSDAKLLDLRKIYLHSRNELDDKLKVAHTKAVETHSKQIQEKEVALTKSGDIDGALALRQERERFVLEFSGLNSAAVAPTEDPHVTNQTATVSPKKLSPVTVPTASPPEQTDPFSDGKWMEALTVPAAKQLVRAPILIGNRGIHKQPTVVIAPHSVWTGLEAGRIDLSFGTVIARHSSFEKVTFTGDLSCHNFFVSSKLENCTISKGGIWYGSVQAAKFYFENCLVKGKFIKGDINTTDVGLRCDTTVFENVEFPKMAFPKTQPADQVANPWEGFVNCRFVRCKIPLSILLLTHDCIFEDCLFVAEPDGPFNATKPVEITLYADNCRSNLPPSLTNIKVIQKRSTDLAGVTIPTVSSIIAEIEK